MVSNYRGISLLDVLSKILERQVYSEILVLLALFLPTGSMVSCQENPLSQLSRVVHQSAAVPERRQQVDVIYLHVDFSKAFDRVSHEKRLFKLECLGIGGCLLAWFQSYLSGRRHRVVIDNESADFLPVAPGVPQG